MAGMSKYLAMALFNMSLNPARAAYTPPGGIWLALHTAPPSDATYGTEATYAGYERQPLNSLTATTQTETATGDVNVLVTNGSAVVFPPSYSTTGQAITHWAIWDSQKVGDGNILYSGALSQSRQITNGDAAVVPETSITILIK